MGLKPGYKQTDVGAIPEDWCVVNASNICSKIQDGTHFSPRPGGNDFLYVTSRNIRFGYLDLSAANRIDTVQHQAIYRRCDVKKGDLLLTKDGANTGNAAINTLDEEFSLLSSVAFLRLHVNRYSAPFFLQQILTSQAQRQIQDAMAGNAITRLTLEKIKKLQFSTPAIFSEQEAIAEALSDADALIESLEQLLAKKRHLKQGAMQELLTGKKRLPGFEVKPSYKQTPVGVIPTDWDEMCLSGISLITTGRKDVNEGNPNGNYPFFTCSRNHTFSDSYSFDTEAILIAGNGEVGNLHYYLGRFEAYQRTYVVHAFRSNVKYVWHQLNFRLIESLGLGTIGSSIPYIKKENLTGFAFPLPPTADEQQAIAAVLSDMDAEIATLEAKLTKACQLKQGMMQELLTGRIRLV